MLAVRHWPSGCLEQSRAYLIQRSGHLFAQSGSVALGSIQPQCRERTWLLWSFTSTGIMDQLPGHSGLTTEVPASVAHLFVLTPFN